MNKMGLRTYLVAGTLALGLLSGYPKTASADPDDLNEDIEEVKREHNIRAEPFLHSRSGYDTYQLRDLTDRGILGEVRLERDYTDGELQYKVNSMLKTSKAQLKRLASSHEVLLENMSELREEYGVNCTFGTLDTDPRLLYGQQEIECFTEYIDEDQRFGANVSLGTLKVNTSKHIQGVHDYLRMYQDGELRQAFLTQLASAYFERVGDNLDNMDNPWVFAFDWEGMQERIESGEWK